MSAPRRPAPVLSALAVLALAGVGPFAAPAVAAGRDGAPGGVNGAVTGAGPGGETGGLSGGVYTLNQERLFAQSLYGRRVMEELARRQQALAAENRKLENQLKVEEQTLTDRRKGMDPKAFRKLADAFDARVERIRKDQARKAQELNRWVEQQRKSFFEAAAALLPGLARDLGARVILDERATFYAIHGADLTPQAIARIDRQLGDGVPRAPQDAASNAAPNALRNVPDAPAPGAGTGAPRTRPAPQPASRAPAKP